MSVQAARTARASVGPAVVRGLVFVAGLSLFCNIGTLTVPLFNMEIFGRVLATRNLGTMGAMAAGLAIGLATYLALDQLRAMAMVRIGDRLARRLSRPLLEAVAGPAAADALRDVELLRQFVGSSASAAPFELMWAPVLLAVLLALHWAFALLAVVCILVLATLNVLGDALSRRQLVAASDAAAAGYRDVASAVRGAEAVIAMGMLPALSRRWDAAQAGAIGAARAALARSRAVTATTRAFRMGMTGAMVALGLILATDDLTTGGAMVAGNMILARVLLPFEQIAATRRQWVGALAAWRRLRAGLEQAVPARYATALPAPAGHLRVERLVHLQAGLDRPVLRGVEFDLAPGEVLGVIGPSGAGKSTLLRLLMGMAEPAGGGVYLDGHSVFLWDRVDLARHVGYVPQTPTLVDATVAENIARLDTPDARMVIAAARLAGVHEFIARMPHGYATRVGGFALSAGQRQRIALARALYGGKRLLLLDEPTGFLDQAGEAMLIDLLRRLAAAGTGAVVVTHRPAVIEAADKLLVLKDGLLDRFGQRPAVLQALRGPRVRLIAAGAGGA